MYGIAALDSQQNRTVVFAPGFADIIVEGGGVRDVAFIQFDDNIAKLYAFTGRIGVG